MVLNDIIEQAAGRQSQTPEQGGNVPRPTPPLPRIWQYLKFLLLPFFFSFFFLFFDYVRPYRSCVYYLVYRVMSIMSCSMYIIVGTSGILRFSLRRRWLYLAGHSWAARLLYIVRSKEFFFCC